MSDTASTREKAPFVVEIQVDEHEPPKGHGDMNRIVVLFHADLAKRYGVNKGQYQVRIETLPVR